MQTVIPEDPNMPYDIKDIIEPVLDNQYFFEEMCIRDRYKRVAVQSLHVIPGEEYLSLMNTDVKKYFMIQWYPHIDVLKGCLLYTSRCV